MKTHTGRNMGLEGEKWEILGGRWKVNARHCLKLTSAHNTIFVFGNHQPASLDSGLYTIMLTHFTFLD